MMVILVVMRNSSVMRPRHRVCAVPSTVDETPRARASEVTGCRLRCGQKTRRRNDERAHIRQFISVFAKDRAERARGTARDLLEGVGRVVVLAGEDRPLARNEQISCPCRYPSADHALEEL